MKFFFIILCALFNFHLFAQVNQGYITLDKEGEVIYLTEGNWLFSDKDNSKNALFGIDDSKWKFASLSDEWQLKELYYYAEKYYWYRLHVKITPNSANRDFAFLLPLGFTALQIYLNGELFYENPDFHNESIILKQELPQLLRIPKHFLKEGENLIAIRTNGVYGSTTYFDGHLLLGDYRTLLFQWFSKLVWVFSLTFISVYLCVYYLFYYFFRKSEKYILYFSFMNLGMGIWLFTYKGFLAYITTSYGSYSLATFFIASLILIALLRFFCGFFGKEISKLGRIFEIWFLLLSVLVLFEYLYTKEGYVFYYFKYMFIPFIQSSILFFAYLTYLSVKVVLEKKEFSVLFLLGIVVFDVCFVYSVLVFLGVILANPIINEAFIFMSLIFAIVLAKRFTAAFSKLETTQAELRVSYDKLGETNRELEELNYTLEERVLERTNQLEDAHQKIRKLEKLNLERQLSGGFAHEIRNALAGAKLVISKVLPENGGRESICAQNSNLLKDIYLTIRDKIEKDSLNSVALNMKKLNDNERDLDQILRLVRDGTERGLKITKQIMEYTHVGATKRGKVTIRLEEVVRSIINETKDELEKYQISLQTEIEKVEIQGEENHFHSIIKNLVLNAKDALCDIEKERLIKITCKKVVDICQIEVIDNGVGISAEDLPKIFEPFYSTKPATGMGLGLGYISKVISAYEGTIDVESEVNKGTKFLVKLPIV